MSKITTEKIEEFKLFLKNEEKSNNTIDKYVRDVIVFYNYIKDKELTKEDVIKYKKALIKKYKLASVNSIISSLNSFFEFNNWQDKKVKNIKIQKQLYIEEERNLTKKEYFKLIGAAKQENKEQIYLILITLASTGIRISELNYITVDALATGTINIINKGKYRTIFLPSKLCVKLEKYIKKVKIKKGPIFITKKGKPLDRSNIWVSMKKLCEKTDINPQKVYPHNLRHLFARTYYEQEKDVVRLADILGHSSINTTRIYTIENGEKHREQIQKLDLI